MVIIQRFNLIGILKVKFKLKETFTSVSNYLALRN